MWNGLFHRESREQSDVGNARIGSDKKNRRPEAEEGATALRSANHRPPAPDRHRPDRRASYRRHPGHSNDESEVLSSMTKAKAARSRAQHAPMSEDDNNTAATASTSSLSSSSSASSSSSSGSIARTGTTNANANNMPHLTMQWSQQGDDERNNHPMTAFPRLSIQEAEDRIRSMRLQEDGPSLGDGGIGNGGPYRTRDYFRTLRRRAARSSDSSGNTKAREELVDEECRIKMTGWCYQVVDHCKIDRECVCIASSYLDRYLITKPGKRALLDRRLFQLAAMTALYVSLKLFEDVNVEPQVMCGLSRGGYTEAEFTDMELDMLMSLRWHVHPPTAVSFVGHFLSLFPVLAPPSSSRIQSSSSYDSRSPRSPSCYNSRSPRSSPSGCDECHREAEAQRQDDLMVELYDCSKYQCELSVNDPTFLGTSQSTIALASLLNAIELFAPPDSMWGHSSEMMSAFLRRVEMAASTKVHSAGVLEARERLHAAAAASLGIGRDVPLHASSFTAKSTEEEEEVELKRRESEGQLSPRCASFGM